MCVSQNLFATVTCQVSDVTCPMSHVTCQMSLIFWQTAGAIRLQVWYPVGLPRLVSKEFCSSLWYKRVSPCSPLH